MCQGMNKRCFYTILMSDCNLHNPVPWTQKQGCGVGVGAGVGVSRSRLFCPESESESESTKFTDSDRLRASSYSRFKEIAIQIT